MNVVIKDLKQGTCEMSGKSGEVLEVELKPGQTATLSVASLTQMIRFNAAQRRKTDPSMGTSAEASSESDVESAQAGKSRQRTRSETDSSGST